MPCDAPRSPRAPGLRAPAFAAAHPCLPLALLVVALGACEVPQEPADVNAGADAPRPADPGLDLGTGSSEPTELDLPLGSDPALPLINATLALTPDGATAVAADAEAHSVYLVDLGASHAVRRVGLPGEYPGRLAVDATSAFVLLRRSSDLVAIDLDTAGVVGRVEVCASPQGVAVVDDLVHVTCRDGQLVSLDAQSLEEVRRLQLDDDLRDVVGRGEGLVVSRFRSAELLFLDAAGEVERRIEPATGDGAVPTIAWRLRALHDGRLLLAHQLSSTQEVVLSAQGYGAFCGSIAAPAVSLIDPDYAAAGENEPARLEFPANRPLPDDPHAHLTRARFIGGATAGIIDVAASEHGLYVVAPGDALTTFPVTPPSGVILRTVDPTPAPVSGLDAVFTASFADGDFSPCSLGLGRSEPDVPVSVAYDPVGERVVVQTRSPARIEILGGAEIPLHDDVRTNTGHQMFHMNTGFGISCASCHPEGRDDGHTWHLGPALRRTQSLEGTLEVGVEGLAPFHWDAEFDDFRQLVDEVLVERMGLGKQVSDEQVELLAAFLDTLPAPPSPPVDETAVQRGRSVFASAATECRECHAGEAFTDNQLHDVGTGGEFVTPPLQGLWARAPYLHDGCAATLEERFGPCGGGDEHGKTSHLSEGELSDLVAFLKSL